MLIVEAKKGAKGIRNADWKVFRVIVESEMMPKQAHRKVSKSSLHTITSGLVATTLHRSTLGNK